MTVRVNDFPLAAKWMIVVESVETAKKLNKDYELDEAEELDKNLKRFLAHIGKSISNIYIQIIANKGTYQTLLQGTRFEVVVRDTED